MDVTVLGCSGTYPTPASPSSGYLVTTSEARVWVDAGNGTFAALQAVADFAHIDAIVLSHVHADHCLDLFPLYYALRFHAGGPLRVPVYAPPRSQEHLAALLAGDSVESFQAVLDFHDIEAADEVEVGDVHLGFARTDHPVTTFAVSLSDGTRRVVYSADTGPETDLASFALGADAFICEASYQRGHAGPPVHLTAEQAGGLARKAEVDQLYLTHLWPTLDRATTASEAAEAWGREPVVLEAGMVLR